MAIGRFILVNCSKINLFICMASSQIYPIVNMNYDLENLASLVADVRELNQMNPASIARLTSQVSSISASMFDLSSLKKSSHLSVSSPNLAAAQGSGILSKFGRKKTKLATSKTHLLKSSDGLDNAAFVEEEGGGEQVRRSDCGVCGQLEALSVVCIYIVCENCSIMILL